MIAGLVAAPWLAKLPASAALPVFQSSLSSFPPLDITYEATPYEMSIYYRGETFNTLAEALDRATSGDDPIIICPATTDA